MDHRIETPEASTASPEILLLGDSGEVLPALEVAGRASNYIGSVIKAAAVPPSNDPPSAEESRHLALWMMSVQAIRALRAAMFLTAIGYPDQAIGLVRLVTELHARARKVFGDESGEYARNWIDGRSGGSGAREVGQDFWEMLSGPPHATIRGTLDWIAISQEDGSTQIEIGPNHRPEISNGTLVFIASEVRDIAFCLARLTGAPGHGLADLDVAIGDGYDTYLPDNPPDNDAVSS